MGTFLSKSNKEAPGFGDNLKSEMKDFIIKTEILLREESIKHKHKNSSSHLRMSQSIDKDLSSLKLCSEKGGNLKIGIISRSNDSKNFIKTIYLEEIHNDTNQNTLISSKNIKHLTILNNNNLQQIQEQHSDSNQSSQTHLTKLISKSFTNNKVKSENIILTKIFPANPDIINDNLIVTCSSNLKPIICSNPEIINSSSAISDHIEIDIDEMNKFLLFSALHDLLIYLPDANNLRNEITYLNLLSDNMLILKLLRRGNFFMVNRKNYRCKAIDTKLDDLVLKLGNSVIHQLDYEQAEEDKVKYLGVMIEHKNSSYVKDLPSDMVVRIKNKFDEFLRKKDYKEYLNKIDTEEREEEIKALKDLKYVIKKIPKLEYQTFKTEFVSKYISYMKANGNNFSSTSGIDHLEEKLTHSFLAIINNKFNLLRSNISFKLMLYHNLEELESSSDFMNSLIFTRNKIVEDIEKSFVQISEVFTMEENYLFSNCNSLMNSITALRHNAVNFNDNKIKSFFNIFNFNGSFVPYNDYLTELRRNYYSFNSVIFISMGKVSNVVFKILEILSRSIASNYTNLFLEVEKNNLNNLSDRLRNFSEQNRNCLNIEEIIFSKVDKINLLAINLFSAFGFSNFTLDRTFPYYLIPSYGGTLISLSSQIFGVNIASSFIFFVTSIILAKFLEGIYMEDSRENFLANSEKLLNFMALKKDRIKYLKNDLEEFCKIYSKETLELIDLILGI